MNSVLSFLKNKKTEAERDNIAFAEKIKELSVNSNITMAKAIEKLSSFQLLQFNEVLDMIGKSISNAKNEYAIKLEDNSILLNKSGRLIGLTNKDSSLWLNGLYNKNTAQIIEVEFNNEFTEMKEVNPNELPSSKTENKPQRLKL